jgi:hypothetical protein
MARETAVGFGWGVIALIGMLTEKRKEGEKAGARRIQRGMRRRPAGAGKKKGRGKGEADRWDPSVGAAVKRKREGESGGPARGVGLGRLGRKGGRGAFVFFSFSFSNFIFKSFFNSNSNQTFANFSQEFYRLFRDHTSNQKPCKPTDDAHTLVVSRFIKLSLIFLELNLISNLISLNP